ncbi:MAG TPA: hypothetical protein VKS82_17890 [Streptosporangiaceae bacterium]|jgi:hypothetical protein|nr:hypothetical protein [Streptosporangiaceae bacterium]
MSPTRADPEDQDMPYRCSRAPAAQADELFSAYDSNRSPTTKDTLIALVAGLRRW